MKNKRIFSVLICIVLSVCAVFLSACVHDISPVGDSDGTDNRNDKAWFTESELHAKGLDNLPAPTGLTGEINTYVEWYNDGYTFAQKCPDKDTFTQNVEIYFNYFKSNFDKKFGKAESFAYSADHTKTYYKIRQNEDLAAYYDDNPCDLYKFYYVTDTTLDGEFLKSDAVWSFEIRYITDGNGGYDFKIYIENAGTTRNGAITNYYNLA